MNTVFGVPWEHQAERSTSVLQDSEGGFCSVSPTYPGRGGAERHLHVPTQGKQRAREPIKAETDEDN